MRTDTSPFRRARPKARKLGSKPGDRGLLSRPLHHAHSAPSAWRMSLVLRRGGFRREGGVEIGLVAFILTAMPTACNNFVLAALSRRLQPKPRYRLLPSTTAHRKIRVSRACMST